MIERLEGLGFNIEGSRVEEVQSKLNRERELGKLRDVAEEFEAIFVNIMLKSMRKSIGETNFLKGYREDIFKDFLYWEYSKLIAKNTNLGIAEKIVEIYRQNLWLFWFYYHYWWDVFYINCRFYYCFLESTSFSFFS